MGARSGQSGGSSPLSEVSYVRGFGMGLLPFVLGFAICTVLMAVEIGNTESGFAFLEFYGSEAWKILAVMFSSAFWSAHPGSVEGSAQFLQGLDTVPEFGYIAVVAGLLTLYGYRTVSGSNRLYSDVGGAVQGATIALGYALLLLVSFFALDSMLDGRFTMNAEIARLVAVAGIGYPVVFGAIGGFLATQRGGSSRQQAAGGPPRGQPPQQRGQQPPQGQRGQQPPQGQQGRQPPQGQRGQQPPKGQRGQQPPQGQQSQQPPQGQQSQQPPQGQQSQQPPQGQQSQQPPQGQQSQQPPQGQQSQQSRGGRQSSRSTQDDTEQEESDDQLGGQSTTGQRDGSDPESSDAGQGVSTCSNCGAAVDAELTSCPNCGTML